MADITRPLMLDSTGQQIANAIQNTMLAVPIVDNLNTADPSKALSAKQGKILNDERVRHTSDVAAGAVPINADQLNGHPDTYFAKVELLWTNSAPTSDFTPQTIQMNLSGYKGIIACCYEYRDSSRHNVTSAFCPIGETCVVFCPYINGNPQIMNYTARRFTASTTGVTISRSYNNASSTENAGSALPAYIYGVR